MYNIASTELNGLFIFLKWGIKWSKTNVIKRHIINFALGKFCSLLLFHALQKNRKLRQ